MRNPMQFRHEEQYRGREALRRLAEAHLVLCGAGAVGSGRVFTTPRLATRLETEPATLETLIELTVHSIPI